MKYKSPKVKLHKKCSDAIHIVEKKIVPKKINLQRQGLAYHWAVLSFAKIQIRKPDYTDTKTTRQLANVMVEANMWLKKWLYERYKA